MEKIVLTFLLSLIPLLSLAKEEEPEAEKRPNIIFIFADDWGWQDLSCHGHPYIKTPNIDRLAAEGTDFHRFTVASAVCSPSRTAVMTGHFPARYSVNGHFAWVPDNHKRGMPDWVNYDAPMLPRILQESGYHTAHFGKWHLSNNMIPDAPTLDYYGYHEFGAFNCSGEQMPYDEDADRAVSFIKKAIEVEKPFFINLWIHEPHTPHHVVPKYRQMFPELENEADSIYAATLAYADKRVGTVLDALDALEISENTLVIFSSDNGPARGKKGTKPGLMYDSATGAGFDIGASVGLTGGRKGAKTSLYEGGVNVPFIARWPKEIKAGAVDNSTLISAVDLLPTFCEIAKAKYPRRYKPDGLSQLKALMGTPSKTRDKALYWKSDNISSDPESNPSWANHSILSDRWKLLTTADQSYTELYDIIKDPLEQNNLLEAKVTIKEEIVDGEVIKKEIRKESSEAKYTARRLKDKLAGWMATLPDAPTGNVFSKLRLENKE